MSSKLTRLHDFSQQRIGTYDSIDQDLRDLLDERDSLQADLAAAQAIIVDAGQQVADLKAENERLREAIRTAIGVTIRQLDAELSAESRVVILITEQREIRMTLEAALQPKEDKQS